MFRLENCWSPRGGPLNEMERVHPRLDMRKDQARNDSMVSRSANLSSLGEFPLTVIDMAFTYIYIYMYIIFNIYCSSH